MAGFSLGRVFCWLTLSVGWAVISACDDGERFQSTGGERDGGGMRDGGPWDGAWPDGTAPGSLDGSQVLYDGAFLPDGRPLWDLVDGAFDDDDDGGTPGEIDVHSCAVSNEDAFEIAVPFVEGGFALAPGNVGFGLGYWDDGSCKHRIDTTEIGSTGPFTMPTPILDACRTIQEIALARAPSGWTLAFTDNSTNTIELHTLALGQDLKLQQGTERRTLTSNTLIERRPALATVANNTLAAWFTETGSQRSISTQILEGAAEKLDVVAADDGHVPIELALAQMGIENAAVAWVEEVASRGVWLQPLDSMGTAVGGPLRMTDFAAPGSTVDLATRESDGGAAIYSVGIDLVNFEVRFRRLRSDATLRGGEVKVISRPLQAKDAGLTRLGGGYAVAYRALPGGPITQPEIRLAFVTREGNVTRDAAGRVVTFPIAPAARDGSRVHIHLSVDGQLLIGYIDGDDTDSNTLHLIRRRLDCALGA